MPRQYSASRTNSHTGTFLHARYASAALSSNGTLFNFNAVDMAHELIWPYLIKTDSEVYSSQRSAHPDELSVKACSHGDCKALKPFDEGGLYMSQLFND